MFCDLTFQVNEATIRTHPNADTLSEAWIGRLFSGPHCVTTVKYLMIYHDKTQVREINNH